MPEYRPMWPDPAAGGGLQKIDALLQNRDAHQELMREQIELEHIAREGQPGHPGLVGRIRRLFRRSSP